jgi:hypothetical protein
MPRERLSDRLPAVIIDPTLSVVDIGLLAGRVDYSRFVRGQEKRKEGKQL